MSKAVINSNKGHGLLEFTHGLDCDRHLASAEIRVQRAWGRALARAQILTAHESEQLDDCLSQAEKEIHASTFEWRMEDEDIHMNLERYVTEKAGELGKRMHFGRSRNDLIATTLRIFVNECNGSIRTGLKNLAKSLEERAITDQGIILPGMTHLQHGQPMSCAHFYLAHAFAILRDIEVVDFSQQSTMSYLPLGSGALAGSTAKIDLSTLANELGFSKLSANSYDAVSDRDFMLQSLFSFAQAATHLSRLTEDIIFYSSSAVGLLELPKNYSTGSSLMPNKRNPDVAELTRAKSARIQSALGEGLAILKGLPLAYNSDLHELKRTYLRAFHELEAILGIFPTFVCGLRVSKKTAAELCNRGHILATDIADHFVTHDKMSFRQAYKKTAELVSEAEVQGKQVHELQNLKQILTDQPLQHSVHQRELPGGTGPSAIQASLSLLSQRLGNL